MTNNFIKNSIIAGILIGLGGYVFLSVSDSLVGACLFSVGLISVILIRAKLYTGQVGYLKNAKDIPRLLGMCGLNIIGAVLMGIMTYPIVESTARIVVTKKLSRPLIQTFILSIICGMLIYLAVECYKKMHTILVIVIPVFAFVASGADHCIANAYYFAAAGQISVKILVYMAVCIIGNAVGSLIISSLQDHSRAMGCLD